MANLEQNFPALTAQSYGINISLQTSVVLQTNLKAGNATTQFLNYPFDSIVKFNHEILMASENGLYVQKSHLDDGQKITSYFEPIKTDFGISNLKRIRFLYLSYKAFTDLKLSITTEQNVSDSYILPAGLFGQHGYRLPISKKLRGRFWTFRISNENADNENEDFSFDEIKALVTVLSHGHNRN